MDTNLPIGLKQWENASWEEPARYVAEKIVHYEDLPNVLSEFEIPEGATVIEE